MEWARVFVGTGRGGAADGLRATWLGLGARPLLGCSVFCTPVPLPVETGRGGRV